MNFDTYANLYYFSAVGVVLVLSVVLHLIFKRKLNLIYSLSISIGLISITFLVVYIFMKKFNPAVYQSYNDWHHARKLTVYKQVNLEYSVLENIQERVQILIEESDSYEEFLPKTDTILKEIEGRIKIKDEMRPVAAVSILLSTFFAYGNPAPDDQKMGCLVDNILSKTEYNKAEPDRDFKLLKDNRIGCCTDFAFILNKYLDWMKYEQRIVSIGGHVLNEFKVNEDWYTVDANTGLIANRPFIGDMEGVEVFYLPHFGMMESPYYRPVLIAFRDYIDKVFVNQKFAKALFIEYLNAEEYLPY